MTDGELLRDYVRSGSQAAFAELVRRHADWVYCTAVRLVHDATLAEDVTQAVFIVLVRKAKGLPSSVSLNRWLFQVTRYSAIHALRDEGRRKRREHQAADWAASGRSQESESADDWNQIVARLDAATARLPATDRQVVLLRFYERKSMAEVGLALGVSDDAAKKRVARAVERLRGMLCTEGAALPADAFATMLLAHTTHAAPPALAKSIAGVLLSSAGMSGAGGQAVSIAKGAIQMIIMREIRRVAAIAVTAIVSIGLVWTIAAIVISRSTPATADSQPETTSSASAVADTQTSDAPYVKAIRLVKEIQKGPDAGRIDPTAPLDAATAAFLDRNAPIFDLVHAGAVAHSTDWGVGSGASVNMQQALDQLSGARSLANLEVLRARLRWSNNDSLHGQEDLLDALALGRNITHDHPILVIMLVHTAIEQMVFTHWAQLLPSTPADQLAALPDRLKQLPALPTMAGMIRAEQSYAVNASNAPAAAVASMAPFYDFVSASLDKNPTPTAGEFQKMLNDGLAKIGQPADVGRQLAQILTPSLARAYNSISIGRVTREMFMSGVAVLRDGEGAASRSQDPFGQGPFEYARTPKGFELRSKLQAARDGKQVKLDFGN